MNLSLSLVNVFLSPVVVGIVRQRARARKLTDFFHQGIAIYCHAEQVPLLKAAVDEVIVFFGDDWKRYRKNVKKIFIDDELQTILWVARRAVIIRESDSERLESSTQLAGWLVADIARVQAYKERRCGHIIWSKTVPALAKERARVARDNFLSGH